MIAFDLDGIFVPDIKFDNEEQLYNLLNVRSEHLIPILQPTFPYCIITGRPKQDKADTLRWINQMFSNPPNWIFHDNEDIHNPVAYKASVLQDNPDIEMYVESSIEQVEELKKLNLDCKIIHFEDMVLTALQQKR